MPIPDFQTIMLPTLSFLSDLREHATHEIELELARTFRLTEEQIAVLLPSGQQTVFRNRAGWARTYLKKAGLINSPKRTIFQISERGSSVLLAPPEKIDIIFLKQYPEFLLFWEKHKNNHQIGQKEENAAELNPEEALEDAYQKLKDDLSIELLEHVLKSTPEFFEKLVVELLVNMGYGGSRREAARAVGKSGDEGIDGIIDEDRLGLDTIYIQAKKWNTGNTVGRPEVQKFVGALQGQRAKKGIFITTSEFAESAKDYAKNIDTKVVLIDGKRLTELMIDFGVGVSHKASYEVKSIDTDYFEVI